jgi:hypothetical protein
VDTFVDKIVKELAEEEIFTDNMAKEVDKTVEDIQSDIPAAVSVLGLETQPERVFDDVTSQNVLVVAVLSHMVTHVEVFMDDVNMIHDESMSEEGNKYVVGCDVGVEKGPLVMVQKEVNGHGPVLSGPSFAKKSVVSGPWSAEWLKDHHGEAGIIFAAKRRVFKAGKLKGKNSLAEGVGTKRRWRVCLAKIDVLC